MDIALLNLEATVTVSPHASLVFLPPALARLDLCCSLNLPRHEGQVPPPHFETEMPRLRKVRRLAQGPTAPRLGGWAFPEAHLTGDTCGQEEPEWMRECVPGVETVSLLSPHADTARVGWRSRQPNLYWTTKQHVVPTLFSVYEM